MYVGQCYGATWPRHGMPCGISSIAQNFGLESERVKPVTFGDMWQAYWQGPGYQPPHTMFLNPIRFHLYLSLMHGLPGQRKGWGLSPDLSHTFSHTTNNTV
jgi:hypothetical protein